MKYILPIILSLWISILNARPLYKNIGNVLSIRPTDYGFDIKTERANVQVMGYTTNVVRIRIMQDTTPDFSYAVIRNAADCFKNFTENRNKIKINTDSIFIEINKQPFEISFYNAKNQLLNADYASLSNQLLNSEIITHKKMLSDEKFIGLGEKTGGLNKRGNAYTNWNTDKFAYPVDHDPLYKTIPFYIGIHDSLCYGIFLDNSYKTHFNFGASTDDAYMSFSCEAGDMNYYFIASQNVAQIIENYTWLTGRMPMPPLWSLGYQQSRWSYMSSDDVLEVAKTFRAKKIPCDVLYNDIDYMDRYRVFTWNTERFKNPNTYIKALHDLNFRLTVIIDPGIAVANDYSVANNGLKKNVFVCYPNGKPLIANVWPGRCYFPDFTKPVTRKWWSDEIKNMVAMGVDGFWNDMNEPASWGMSLSNTTEFDFDNHKTTMKQAHNIYGMQMTRASYEGVYKQRKERPFLLTRATYAGGQRYSAVWTGDNDAYDDHMLLGVRLLNNLGLCGFAFAGTDIGGFANNPSNELFQRWLSIAVYTPFFRNHAKIETRSREPWAMGETVTNFSRNQIEMRYKLLPYLYSKFYEATQTGMPVARTLAINYTFDKNVYNSQYENEFLFGDAILVAPCKSTEMFTKVYLPYGIWYRLETDSIYIGEQTVIAEAPLNSLPVFVKGGSIIPMQHVIQNTAQHPGDTLQIHIYKSTDVNCFTFYTDDGISYAYENNNYYKRNIMYDGTKNSVTLSQPKGNYVPQFTHIAYVMHGFNKNINMYNNGNTLTKSIATNTITFYDVLQNQELVYTLNQ